MRTDVLFGQFAKRLVESFHVNENDSGSVVDHHE